MLNEAYATAHCSVFSQHGKNWRYPTAAELLDSLTERGFLFVTFDNSNGEQPIAAAGAKPWDIDTIPFAPQEAMSSNDDDIDEWELTAVAVKPSHLYSRKGLVEHLLSRIDEEIVQRAASKTRRIRMVVRTSKVINGQYWEKKGYRLVLEQVLPKEALNTVKPYVRVIMERWLAGTSRTST